MDFETAAKRVQSLQYCSDNDKLILYGLFKQGTVGDLTSAKPTILDYKGRAKWDAWHERKGMSKVEAQELYIKKVEELISCEK